MIQMPLALVACCKRAGQLLCSIRPRRRFSQMCRFVQSRCSNPGGPCLPNDMPALRGVCVQPLNSRGFFDLNKNDCWDVCNIAHRLEDYVTGMNDDMKVAVVGIVGQVREGKNPAIGCPGFVALDQCDLGDSCSPQMLRSTNITQDRGMCVDASDVPGGRARECWDICDDHKLPAMYTRGTPEGTAAKVLQARSSWSWTCKPPWWLWPFRVLLGLIFLCAFACCVVAALRTSRITNRTGWWPAFLSRKQDTAPSENQEYEDESGYQEQEDRSVEDYAEVPPPPAQQFAPSAVAEPIALPVERREVPQYDQYPEYAQQYEEQRSSGNQFSTVTESMPSPVPGLVAPRLQMPNLQPLQMAQTATQAVSGQPLLSAPSYPPVHSPYARGAAGSPAFQTQISSFSTQIPSVTPGLYAAQPASMTLPPAISAVTSSTPYYMPRRQ